MRFPLAGLGLVLAFPLVGLTEDAQTLSLAERAERARERKGNAAPKVLTNEDLRKARGTVIVLPEPEPAASPAAGPSPATTVAGRADPAVPVENTGAAAAPPDDPTAVREAIQEHAERAARYRKALQQAENELQVGGDRLTADRRAALTRFLVDGRRELTWAELALAKLQARPQGPAARQ